MQNQLQPAKLGQLNKLALYMLWLDGVWEPDGTIPGARHFGDEY